MKSEKQRTNRQNNAFHLLCQQLADHLNDIGFEKKITIGTISVPWTLETVKALYKKVSFHMYQKEHTSDLTTKELQMVVEVVNRALAEEGVEHIPFPSIEEVMHRN